MNRFAFIADRLGYGDDLDAVLCKLAKVKLLLKCLAEKPAVTMHDDEIDGMFTVAGAFNHLLKRGATIIARRGTCFDEFGNHFVALCPAP